jgi:hypothetical protein
LCLCAEGGPLDLTAKLEQDRTLLAKDPHRRSELSRSVNGADGISDIEAKVARVSDEGDGVPPFSAKVAEVNHMQPVPSVQPWQQ